MSCCSEAVQTIRRGITGNVRALVNPAPPAIVNTRRDMCRHCDQATRNPSPKFAAANGLTTLSKCQLCHCLIVSKTKDPNASCPVLKWPAIPLPAPQPHLPPLAPGHTGHADSPNHRPTQ